MLHVDVKDLHEWHVEKCTNHPCFERVPDEEALTLDPCTNMLFTETEEGKKVTRLGGKKFFAVFRRRAENELPPPLVFSLFGPSSDSAVDTNSMSKEA